MSENPGRVVLVTGGTKGLGLAIGEAFGGEGDRVVLTHRWSSADEDEIRGRFEELGAKTPMIVQADAGDDGETRELLELIRDRYGVIDVFVHNVCVVPRSQGAMDYRRRDLLRSIDYSAWPFIGTLQGIASVFGRYPRYALALSSDGADRHYPGYGYVALAKSVLETLAKYWATHLREAGCRVNVIRTRQVTTDGFGEMFGEHGAAVSRAFAEYAVEAEQVADVASSLCSGLWDALSGQVITVDHGSGFVDNMMTLGQRLFEEVDHAR